MPRLFLLTVVSLLAVALLGGCGSRTEPAALAPPRPFLYGEVDLAPPGGQKAAIDALARKLPGAGDAGQRLGALVEDGLRDGDAKLSFERDVKPWLGDRAAFFAAGPGGAGGGDTPAGALVATEDEDKALAAIQKQQGQGTEAEYGGVKYRRLAGADSVATTLEGYLVVANEPGLRAVVDASKNGRRSLEASERFKTALRGAPSERLAFAYIDAASAFDALPPSQAPFLAPFRRVLGGPIVASASARPDALEVTARTPESQLSALGVTGIGSAGTDLIGKLPGDSLLASGGPDLGRQLAAGVNLAASAFGGRDLLEQGLRQGTGLDLQRDVLAWMGDFGIFVRGRDRRSLGGALVVETRDPAATRRAIAGFRRMLRREASGDIRVGPRGVRGADAGFTVTARRLPEPISVFLKSKRFVVAYGSEAADQAVSPRSKLQDESAFRQATGPLGGSTVSTYASVPASLLLAEGLGAARDSRYQRAKPYLAVLGAVVIASRPAGNGQLESRLRVTIPG